MTLFHWLLLGVFVVIALYLLDVAFEAADDQRKKQEKDK